MKSLTVISENCNSWNRKDFTITADYDLECSSCSAYGKFSYVQKYFIWRWEIDIPCDWQKDMSRLGRDYLLVGQYTEMIFPSYGVRFIAVNNNVDSLYGDNDFTTFVNLFNDFYAKDTSRKIRAVVKSKAERGKRVATRAPYGYKKDENNPKSRIVPDEDDAPIVQRIFSLCVGGKGPTQIAKQLKSEQVFTPGYYYYSKTGVLLTNVDVTRPYDWNSRSVADILRMKSTWGIPSV